MKLDIVNLLEKSNAEFNSDLITTDINSYVDKLISHATIMPIFEDNNLIAFIAYYNNDEINRKAYLSMIAVKPDYGGKGYGSKLLEMAIQSLIKKNYKYFDLEVLKTNDIAIKFYKKYNFQIIDSSNELKYYMRREL